MQKRTRTRKDGTKSNLWCGMLSVGRGSNGKRRRLSVYGKTQAEVRHKLARLRLQPRLADPADPRLTVGDFLTRWLEDSARPAIRHATYVVYARQIRVHLAPRIGKIPLAKLAPAHVASLLSDMERAGASARQRQITLGVLRVALQQAVKWGQLLYNPCASVSRPKAPRKPFSALTLEETRAFLDSAVADRFYALYVLALATGMRQGELLGLQWDEVDLKARALSVRSTLTQDARGELKRAEPKTHAGRRRIELPQFAVDALHEQQRRLLAQGLRASPWVFPDTRGGPMRKDNLMHRSFKPLLAKASLPAIRFHDLRHTAATLMLLQGVHAKVVQERLGHSKIALTLDTYSHVLPSMQREAADRLDHMFLESDSAS